MKSFFPFPDFSRVAAGLMAAVGFAAAPAARATGDWNSVNLLQDHQFAAISSPEFWFELEMKDLAKAFPVKEKHVSGLTTAQAELASFDEAVKAGKVDAADEAALRKQLEETRALLTPPEPVEGAEEPAEPPAEPAPEQPAAEPAGEKPDAAPPAEEKTPPAEEKKEEPKPEEPEAPLPTEEFALYQRGAKSYAGLNYKAARAAWKALLALPAEKRHYRSVWAAYMLGRTEIAAAKEEGTKPQETAPPYFAQTRELAAGGFADPLGLAAASYGWEAFVWTGTDSETAAPEKALELYFKQLASGDDAAFTSIKFVVRSLLFPETDINADPNQTTPPPAEAWEKAAKSPLLRKIVTRWYLAMNGDTNNRWAGEYAAERDKGPQQWLELLEKNHPQAEEADRLAWLAYREGAYDQAQRWLKLVPAETRLSLWLTAKLALRAGNTAAAAAAMEKVDRLFDAPERLVVSQGIHGTPLPKAAARADHAVVLLGLAKFPEALTAFLEAGHWQDAAYVAERILTLAELKAYVDQNYPKPAKREEGGVNRNTLGRVVEIPEGEKAPEAAELPPASARDAEFDFGPRGLLESAIINGDATIESEKIKDAIAWRLRWLLGRRMVREDQEPAARPYLPRDVQPALDAYVAALAKAADKKTPKAEQAKSWWTAAWIARHAGMELMGTEMEPDGAWDDGYFDTISMAVQRRTGLDRDNNAAEDEEADATRAPKLTVKVKFGVPPSAEEKKRLAKHVLPREYRYHYRWVAAALAKKAAALLADGTEEKADVLNQAGSWMFSRDVKAEEAFFFEIKKTCPNTKIGKEVLKTKHTTPLPGPWSGKPDEDA